MSTRGGARPGAGRPTNPAKHQERVGRFTDRCAEYLDLAFDNLVKLAEGTQRVQRKQVAAGTILRKDVVRKADGSPWLDGKGKPMGCEVLAHPDLPPDQLLDGEVITTDLPPDERANEYLVNRVMGMPSQAREADPERIKLREALVRVRERMAAYRDPDKPADPDDDPGAIYHGA